MPFNSFPADPRVSRRAALAGAVGAVASGSLASPVLAESKPTPRKQLLLLFLSGGASQFET
jgi:hypothetical protein